MSDNIDFSNETQNDFLIAFVITAIIVILTITYGNTGSDFFRNFIVFIVGSIIGTPIAMLGKWITSFFTNNELYKYSAFILGAIIGTGIASSMFSNKLEKSFVYNCVREYRLSKSTCE